MFTLLACAEPGLLESVTAGLADQAVERAELPMRTMTAVTGLMGEVCEAESPGLESYDGAAAVALGVGAHSLDESGLALTFEDMGLDGRKGTLLVTTTDWDNLAILWTDDDLSLSAGLEVNECETDLDAIIGGNGTWTDADGTVSLTIVGAAPSNGLTFAPPGEARPTGGHLRASNDDEGWAVLTEDAADVSLGAEAWPGTATGNGWAHTIEVGWP